MSKTSVNCKPVADNYSGQDEKVIEFQHRGSQQGGLILFRLLEDGRLLVQPYNCDSNVVVLAGKGVKFSLD